MATKNNGFRDAKNATIIRSSYVGYIDGNHRDSVLVDLPRHFRTVVATGWPWLALLRVLGECKTGYLCIWGRPPRALRAIIGKAMRASSD